MSLAEPLTIPETQTQLLQEKKLATDSEGFTGSYEVKVPGFKDDHSSWQASKSKFLILESKFYYRLIMSLNFAACRRLTSTLSPPLSFTIRPPLNQGSIPSTQLRLMMCFR